MKPRPHIVAAHVAQLRQRGSTTMGLNHARSALLVVAAALCAAPCLFALVSIVTDRGFSGALAHPGAWGALLGSAFFGLGLFILLAQLVRPPALVIDRGGVRFLRGSEGQVAAVEWKDVDDITVVRLRTTTMVKCALTPEAAARRRAGAGRVENAFAPPEVWSVPPIFATSRELPEILRAALHGYRTGWRL